MTRNRNFRWITLSLVLAGMATAALAEDKVRDKNGALVGNIQGWEGRKPVIVFKDGSRFVPLRVARKHFETVDIVEVHDGRLLRDRLCRRFRPGRAGNQRHAERRLCDEGQEEPVPDEAEQCFRRSLPS